MHNKETLHISVVVPVFNEREFLSHCLDALCAQTIKPNVVYVVDNNSTDETVEIASKYPFVKILHQPIQGICAATKAGLDAAASTGGIILRCDADSRPRVDWIERILTVFNDKPSVIGVTGPGEVYDCSKLLTYVARIAYMKPYFFFTSLALGQYPLFGSNFAIRASVWLQISDSSHLGVRQDIHDDIDISYHIVTKGPIQYDETIIMPISARPFKSFSGMINRFIVGFRSIFIHWPEQAPWRRFSDQRRKK